MQGGGLFLALNVTGRILVSEDGLTWTERPLGAKHRLRKVIHTGGFFLGVGDSGTVMTSADANTWSLRNAGTVADLYSVAYGNGQYLAVGDKGTLLASVDGGKTWTPRESKRAGRLTAVAYGGSGFVAIEAGGACLFSHDGIAWTSGPVLKADGRAWARYAIGPIPYRVGPLSMLSVAYGKGRYVAVGEKEALMVSPDGEKWTDRSVPVERFLRGLIFNGRQFVAVGTASVICTSTDGITWKLGSTFLLHALPGGSAYGRARFVVRESYGKAGYTPDSRKGGILPSSRAKQSRSTPADAWLIAAYRLRFRSRWACPDNAGGFSDTA